MIVMQGLIQNGPPPNTARKFSWDQLQISCRATEICKLDLPKTIITNLLGALQLPGDLWWVRTRLCTLTSCPPKIKATTSQEWRNDANPSLLYPVQRVAERQAKTAIGNGRPQQCLAAIVPRCLQASRRAACNSRCQVTYVHTTRTSES